MITVDSGKPVSGSDCAAPGGANTIVLPAGRYELTIAPEAGDGASSGDLNVSEPVTISGAGKETTIVKQTKTDRVVHVESVGVKIAGVAIEGGHAPSSEDGGGILIDADDGLALTSSSVSANEGYDGGGLFIGAEADVTIEGSLIEDDHSADAAGGGGGGIFNEGATKLENTTLAGDTTMPAGFGGAISNFGPMSISGGEIGPHDEAGAGGGGILSTQPLIMTATTVTQDLSDDGGGLYIEAGGAALTDVTVSDNTAMENGGGITALGSEAGPVALIDTTVAGNGAKPGLSLLGGGIYAIGDVSLSHSWVHNNTTEGAGASAVDPGGGIYYEPSGADATLSVEGSTIGPENAAEGGAGIYIYKDGHLSLTRSTVSANGFKFAKGSGILIAEAGQASLRDVTLADNVGGSHAGEGGNLFAEKDASVSFENTLVAQALEGNCGQEAGATLTSHGGDEEYGDEGDSDSCDFDAPHDAFTPEDLTAEQLAPLANNGGPTETMALAPGSPPVGTGFGCEPTDQRGVPRPPAACDSGAYQLVTSLIVSITSGPSGPVSTPDVSFSFSAEAPSTFQCRLDGGSFAPCSSPFSAGPLALGTHTFTVKASDPADLLVGEASRTFTVEPTSALCGCSLGPPLVVVNPHLGPIVSGLAQSHARWREGRTLARISRAGAKPPRGTTFSFTLNEAAGLRLAFTQPAGGRRVAGRCVAQTRHNLKKHACRRTVTVGVLTLTGSAGSDRVRFEGRLSATKRLKPGHYTLMLSAFADGLSSAARTVHFTIVG